MGNLFAASGTILAVGSFFYRRSANAGVFWEEDATSYFNLGVDWDLFRTIVAIFAVCKGSDVEFADDA